MENDVLQTVYDLWVGSGEYKNSALESEQYEICKIRCWRLSEKAHTTKSVMKLLAWLAMRKLWDLTAVFDMALCS